MARMTLVRASPRNPATGAIVPVYLAGGGGAEPYYREGQHYRAGVEFEPRFTAALSFEARGWSGGTVPTVSTIAFAPADPALVDELCGYFWNDASIEVDAGDDGAPLIRQLTGAVANAAVQDGKLIITIADFSNKLNTALATSYFAGTGGMEGESAAAGRIKRRSFGRVFNVECLIFDEANNIYEFGDTSRPQAGCVLLRDKGRAGFMDVLAWQGSAAATLAALRAATPPVGGGTVAPSIACVKWWTQPAGPLTGDFLGEIGAGYSENAAVIAAAISASMGGPAIGNLVEAAAWRPAPVGIHIGDASETAAQAIDRLLLGISLLWRLDPGGEIQLRQWSFAGPAETLEAVYLGRDKHFPPTGKRRVGYRRNNRQHSDGDIAAILRDDLLYEDGTPVEDLKPAEPGATLGAPVGTPVAGMSSEDLVEQFLHMQSVDIPGVQAGIEQVLRTISAASFDREGAGRFEGTEGDPEILASLVADDVFSFPLVAGIGRVLRVDPASSGDKTIADVAPMRMLPGRQYRISARVRAVTVGTNPAIAAKLLTLGADFLVVAGGAAMTSDPLTTDWSLISVDLDPATAIGEGGIWARPALTFADGTSVFDAAYMLIEDVTESANAKAQADIALNQATAASSSAAAAQSSATLSASVGLGTLNENPTFVAYLSAAPLTPPEHWALWSLSDPGTAVVRTAGNAASPFAVSISRVASGDAGIVQRIGGPGARVLNDGDWMVLEADILLAAGSLSGSGLAVDILDDSGVSIGLQHIDFSLDVDAQEKMRGDGVVGRTYSFSKLLPMPTGAHHFDLIPAAGYNNLPTLVTAANTIIFYKAAARIATSMEVALGTANSGLRAAVNILQGAVANITGKAGAYLKQEAYAGTGAEAFVTIGAERNNPAAAPLTMTMRSENVLFDAAHRTLARIDNVGASWTRGARSDQSYTGSAYLSFTVDYAGTSDFMMGLNSDPDTDDGYTSLDHAFQIGNDGNVYIYESGSGVAPSAPLGAYSVKDVYSIEYASTTIIYRKNGKVVRSAAVSAGLTFYLDASMNWATGGKSRAGNIVFGPEAPGAYSSVGLGAVDISLFNMIDGAFVKALTVSNGQARFWGKLFAENLQVGNFTPNLVYNNGGQLSAGPSPKPSAVAIDQVNSVDGWAIYNTTGSGCYAEANFYLYRTGNANSIVIYNPSHSASTGMGVKSLAFPVVPGKQYVCRCGVTDDGGGSGGGGLYLRLNYGPSIDATESYVDGAAAGHGIWDWAAGVAAPDAAQEFSGVWTCPAGVYWAEVHLYNWVNGSNYMIFTNLSVKEMVEGGEIRAQTIIASKFLTDQGVDLAAIVPGSTNTGFTSSAGGTFTAVRKSSPSDPINYNVPFYTPVLGAMASGALVFINWGGTLSGLNSASDIYLQWSPDYTNWYTLQSAKLTTNLVSGTYNYLHQQFGLTSAAVYRIVVQNGSSNAAGNGHDASITNPYIDVTRVFKK